MRHLLFKNKYFSAPLPVIRSLGSHDLNSEWIDKCMDVTMMCVMCVVFFLYVKTLFEPIITLKF